MGPEAAALLGLLLSTPAGDPSGPWARWHFVFGKEMEMSVLFRRDAGGDETRLLVRCEAGRFELSSRQDPSGRESEESIRSLEEAETFTRRLSLMPSGADGGCEGVTSKAPCVVLEGRAGSVSAGLSRLTGEEGAALRERCAALVSAGMKKRLFSLAPLLTYAAEFGSYTDDFLGLVWPESFRRPAKLRRGTQTVGCDFDAGFGRPCALEEWKRETKRFRPVRP